MKILTYCILLLSFLFTHTISAGSADAGQTAKIAAHEFPQALSVGKQETAEPPPTEPLFDNALAAIKAGKYDQALTSLQALQQGSSEQRVREKVLRLIADCYYYKGLSQDSHAFLTAVEQYKAVLQHYPDPARENDSVYYRLALSYEGLNFFYEAAGTLDTLVAIYPDSRYLPDAMFRLAELLHQVGKYNRAIERFIAYLTKYPDGKYAKISHFYLGDCYYRVKKGDFAGRWYDEAWKRWPDFHELRRDILLNMGNHYFEAARYVPAYQVYALHWNLYPGEESSRIALYRMGQASEAMGQITLALKLYSLLIEKYPAAKEAEECTLVMANLGVSSPGIKFPHYIIDTAGYLEPLKTYDRLLAKKSSGEQTANILFFKGNALAVYGRTKDSFNTYAQLLNAFQSGRYTDAVKKSLKVQAASLVNTHYAKDDFLAVADIYFQGYGENLLSLDDFEVGFKIAESLRKVGLVDEAAGVCEKLLGTGKDSEQGNRVIAVLAKIDLAKGRYDEAENKLAGLSRQVTRDSQLPKDVKLTLADLYYKKNQFEKAAPLYADIMQNAAEVEGLDRAYGNYGRVLLARNMTQAAVNHYLRALTDYEAHPQRFHAEAIADIYMGLGDAYCSEAKHSEAIAMYRKALNHASDGESKRWLLTRIGKAYAAQSDVTGAEKNFSQVKEAADGEFWPKVADYFSTIGKTLARQGN